MASDDFVTFSSTILSATELTTTLTRWLPIETAPTDGTPFLGYDARIAVPKNSCVMAVVMKHGDDFGVTRGMWWGPMPNAIVMISPTHWMPLPDPPA